MRGVSQSVVTLWFGSVGGSMNVALRNTLRNRDSQGRLLVGYPNKFLIKKIKSYT